MLWERFKTAYIQKIINQLEELQGYCMEMMKTREPEEENPWVKDVKALGYVIDLLKEREMTTHQHKVTLPEFGVYLEDNYSKMYFSEPEHYKIDGMNTIKVIIQLADAAGVTTEEKIYLFNAFKYLLRHRKKNGEEVLNKAIDYINRLIIAENPKINNETWTHNKEMEK